MSSGDLFRSTITVFSFSTAASVFSGKLFSAFVAAVSSIAVIVFCAGDSVCVEVVSSVSSCTFSISAAEETEAAKAEDIQPEKTADTSAISAENSFPENTEAAAEKEKTVIVDMNKSPEDMTVDELQQAILAQMAGNGPVTDQMKKTVYDNIWHDSLVNWLKSYH